MGLNSRGSSSTVVAIRLRALGDVLATLGALRALKQADPHRRIAYVIDSHYHGLLSHIDYIDELIPEPPRISGLDGARAYDSYVSQMRALNPSCVLDFHSNTRSALLSYFSGAPRRIGFDVRFRKVLYTDVEPRAVWRDGRIIPRTSHESAMALTRRLESRLSHGSIQRTIPVTPPRSDAGKHMLASIGIRNGHMAPVGINPGNPYPAKHWDDSRYVDLSRRLVSEGRQVVLLWGPGERDRAQRIVSDVGPGAFLSPPLSLEELPGFLRQLSVLVTIDSGLKHLAVAVGAPTVTVFGPTHPDEWHMGGERDRYVFANLSCSPCRLMKCPFGTPCMRRIKPEHVLREVIAVERSAHAS
jgi:ADP-heptose:LPS heptosyltransferase